MAPKLLPLVAALLVVACSPALSATPDYSADCVDPSSIKVDGSVNLFPLRIQSSITPVVPVEGATQIRVAQNFQVTYYNTYKVVKLLRQADLNETYVLYPCGAGKPDMTQFPGAKAFEIPLKAVAAPDTTVNTFLRMLGVQDRVAFASQYSIDPCMQALTSSACGKVYRSNSTGYDAVFDFGIQPKNAKAINFQATKDSSSPLARAEYIKFVATFFNKEATANSAFASVESKYNQLKAAAAAAQQGKTRPTVAWTYYQPSYGSTGRNREHVTLYNTPFRAEYITASGGQALDTAALYARLNTGAAAGLLERNADGDLDFYNLTITMPLVREALKGVAVVLDETAYRVASPAAITKDNFLAQFGFTNADLQNPDYPFLVTGRILRNDGVSSADGWTAVFEDQVARPDLVLQDMIAALTPEALPANTKPYFIRSIFDANRVTLIAATSCPLQNCALTAAPICPAVYTKCDGTLAYRTDDTAAPPCRPTCPTQPAPAPVGSADAERAMIAPVLVTLVGLLAAVLANVVLL